jgi:hypothetical protein
MLPFVNEPCRHLRMSLETDTRLFLIDRLLSTLLNRKPIVSHLLLSTESFGGSGIEIHWLHILLLNGRLSQRVALSFLEHSQLRLTSLTLLFLFWLLNGWPINLKDLHRNSIGGPSCLSNREVIFRRPLLVDFVVNWFGFYLFFWLHSWVSQLSPTFFFNTFRIKCFRLGLVFLYICRETKDISWVSEKVTPHSCNLKLVVIWCQVVLLDFDGVSIILSFRSYDLGMF